MVALVALSMGGELMGYNLASMMVALVALNMGGEPAKESISDAPPITSGSDSFASPGDVCPDVLSVSEVTIDTSAVPVRGLCRVGYCMIAIGE
jgi:hypothetical protein